MKDEDIVELYQYINGKKEIIIFGVSWLVESYEKHVDNCGMLTLTNGCNFDTYYQGVRMVFKQQKMELTDKFFLEIMKQWRK